MTTDPLQPLMDALRSVWSQADHTSLVTAADQLLRGQPATLGASTASLTFGQGNSFDQATVTIGNIAGGNINQITINFPQPINPQAAILQQLLYHHESATIFANRLDTFVGREAEIAEIRQLIARVMPTGGYVTITAQAGEGKSSVIARMVSQDGPDQTAFHFIALTPGREYQLSLLRPIVARLILKHGLSTTYFPDTSYPAMRDYFHAVLRQLSEHGIQEVIYIDGLDQLEVESSGLRDLSFLPSSPPPGIVLVLGTRPDDTLQPLNVKHVQAPYRLPHLSCGDFRLLLEEQDVDMAAVDRVYTALQGNAFYLGLVVHELKVETIADVDGFVQRIDANPDNLFGFTIDRLRRQDRTLWKEVLQPALALLLVAQEPLGMAALRHLLDGDDADLRTGVQHLGGLVAQDSQGRFFLYHLKVRAYLAEDAEQSDAPFVVSQVQTGDWHRRLATWCVRDDGDMVRIWEDTTGLEQTRRWYARHHYVTHLTGSGAWETLAQVIDGGTYGRHKRRFDPSTHLYALDLDRARDIAVQKDDMPALWRWSLLRVSLTSRIDQWPDDLFIVLVYLGRSAEALSRVELISDRTKRIDLLCKLAPLLPPEESRIVFQRAVLTAMSIMKQRSSSQALLRVATALAEFGDGPQAQDVAGAISDEEQRSQALQKVSEALVKQGKRLQAWEVAKSISTDIEREAALHTVALALAQAGEIDHARAATKIMINHKQRAEVLHKMATLLAQQGQIQQAQDVAQSIIDGAQRAETLCRVADVLAQGGYGQSSAIYDQAWEGASALSDDRQRAQALRSVAVALARAGKVVQVQDVVQSIGDDTLRAEALRSVATMLAQAGEGIQAQSLAESISDPWQRVNTLRSIAVALAQAGHPDSHAIYTQACNVAIAISDPWQRSLALRSVALGLAQIGDDRQARVVAEMISDVWHRSEVLRSIVSVVDRHHVQALCNEAMRLAQAGDGRQALVVADSIVDRSQRTETLHSILSVLIQLGQIEQAHMVAESISQPGQQAEALCSVAVALARTGAVDQARRVAETISNAQYREETLRSVTIALAQIGHAATGTIYNQVQAMAESLYDTQHRAQALGSISVALAQARGVDQALVVIESISDDQQRAKILYTLAFVLVQVGKVAQAHAVAESIVDVRHRDQAFRKVVAGLVQIGHIGEAQVVAEAIFDENQRVDAIGSVAQALAEVDTVSQRNVQDTIQTSTAMDIELVYQDDCSAMKRSISGLWRSAATRSGLLEMVQLAEGYLIGDPDLCQAMVASFAWVDDQLREG